MERVEPADVVQSSAWQRTSSKQLVLSVFLLVKRRAGLLISALVVASVDDAIRPIIAFCGGLFAIILLHAEIQKWFALKFRSVDGEIQICSGWLTKQHHTIEPSQVADVQLQQGLFESLLGLYMLELNNQGGRNADIALSGLTGAQLSQLGIIPPPVETEKTEPGFVRMVCAAISSGVFLWPFLLLLLTAAGVMQSDFLNEQQWYAEHAGSLKNFFLNMPAIHWLLLVPALILLLLAGSVLLSYCQYYPQRYDWSNHKLNLLTGRIFKKKAVLSVSLMQSVLLSQTWLERRFGFFSLSFSGGAERDSQQADPRMLGLSEDGATDCLAQLNIPSIHAVLGMSFERTARQYYQRRKLLLLAFAVLLVASGWYAHDAMLLDAHYAAIFVAAGALMTVFAWYQLWLWENVGYVVTPGALYLKEKSLWQLRIRWVPWSQVQTITCEQGRHAKMNGYTALTVHTCNGSFALPAVPVEVMDQLPGLLLRSCQSTVAI